MLKENFFFSFILRNPNKVQGRGHQTHFWCEETKSERVACPWGLQLGNIKGPLISGLKNSFPRLLRAPVWASLPSPSLPWARSQSLPWSDKCETPSSTLSKTTRVCPFPRASAHTPQGLAEHQDNVFCLPFHLAGCLLDRALFNSPCSSPGSLKNLQNDPRTGLVVNWSSPTPHLGTSAIF